MRVYYYYYFSKMQDVTTVRLCYFCRNPLQLVDATAGERNVLRVAYGQQLFKYVTLHCSHCNWHNCNGWV